MGIRRFSVARTFNLALLTAAAVAGVAFSGGCSSDPAAPGTPAAGAAGASAGAPGAGAPAVAGSGAGGSLSAGAGGLPIAGAGAAGASAGAAGSAGSAGAAGGGTAGASGGGNGVTPTCLTPDPMQGTLRATSNYIECDVEKQAIDFDNPEDFTAGKGPGYAPAMTPVSFTDYGTAFTGSAVQNCHAYCYKNNLTIGVSFTPGSDASTRGEVLFAFPTTVTIANANGRNSLGWFKLDGPALPAGATLTAKMVLKSTTKGLLLANDAITMKLKEWHEFKYFPIQQGFAAADLVDITAIGFRVTVTPNTATAWTGVIYADHFQLRQ